jgi:hypothetical protein
MTWLAWYKRADGEHEPMYNKRNRFGLGPMTHCDCYPSFEIANEISYWITDPDLRIGAHVLPQLEEGRGSMRGARSRRPGE